LYDPKKKVGGMLHYLLPEQTDSGSSQQKSPLAYVNTGFEILLEKIKALTTVKKRLIVKAVGGAQLLGQTNTMDIGQDNYQALLKVLKQHGMSLSAENVGGDYSRTAMLEIDSGNVTIRAKKKVFQI
ncbi:MAG: chemotaxis protein CheD, partial [Planctomycetes bacterium]|nr:chemotaxis protein CheD [Planctomycetota bacterium]